MKLVSWGQHEGDVGGARCWWWMAMIDLQHDGGGLVAEIEPGAGGEDLTVRMWAGSSWSSALFGMTGICEGERESRGWSNGVALEFCYLEPSNDPFWSGICIWRLEFELSSLLELRLLLLIPWLLSSLDHLLDHVQDWLGLEHRFFL